MSPWNWTRNYVTSNQKIRNAFITPTDSICEYIRGKHRELLSTFLNNPISPVKTDSIHELAEYISTYANSLFHVLLTIFWSRLKNEWYNELLEKIEWKYDWVSVWNTILFTHTIRYHLSDSHILLFHDVPCIFSHDISCEPKPFFICVVQHARKIERHFFLIFWVLSWG